MMCFLPCVALTVCSACSRCASVCVCLCVTMFVRADLRVFQTGNILANLRDVQHWEYNKISF